MVFGVGLEHFFIASADRPALAIVRKKDRVRLPDRPGDDAPSYFFESLDFPVSDRRMEAFYAEFEPRSEPPVPHSHAGAEVIFVMSGQLVLNIGDEDALLGDGDSIYFNSGFSHSYRRQGHARCSAIVVVSPDKR
jgi:quercetin dioxygenase-like cupin family protein